MSGQSTYQPTHPVLQWLEKRLPIGGLIHSSFIAYPTPRNLNYWWTFGGILSFMLGVQIITGVILAMHYTPHVDMAFRSVEAIMRDVNFGWLLRYLHANGAAMFFLAVYIHMFRGMYYGSYKEPREVLWILGVIIYLLMMATGFMGYVLVWGQMSFWAATVITNLFSAIPGVGDTIVTWLWGGYAVGNPTLNRFYSLHYLLPFAIAGVVVLHVWALHVTGQNNPDGVEPKSDKDTLPFTPYATVKDGFFLVCFCLLYAWFVFYIPNYLGHADNYIPANPAVTPPEIVPEWYYLPFYAILRSIPNKLLGVCALFGSIGILAFLPWLDTSKVRSARYRPLYRQFFWLFVVAAIGARLARHQAAGRHLCHPRARLHVLLLRVFPDRAAAARHLREDQAGAEFYFGIGFGRQGVSGQMKIQRSIFALVLAGRARRAGATGVRAIDRAGAAAAVEMVVRRPVRQIRRSATAARLQDLQGSLRQLPFAGDGFVPQSGRRGRSRLQRGAGRGAGFRIQGQGSRRPGQPDRASRAAGRLFPGPFPNEHAAKSPRRHRAARHVDARQGAQFQPRLSLVHLRRCHAVPGELASTTSWPSSPASRTRRQGMSSAVGCPLQRILPRPCDRHAAAAADGPGDLYDGAPQTMDQYAKDVAAFLMWRPSRTSTRGSASVSW